MDNQYQNNLEILAVLYSFILCTLFAIGIFLSPSSVFLVSLEASSGITKMHLAVIALIVDFTIPFMLTRTFKNRSVLWRRGSYVLTGIPILVYVIPLIFYVLNSNFSPLGALLLGVIYFAYVVIALAVYRK